MFVGEEQTDGFRCLVQELLIYAIKEQGIQALSGWRVEGLGK